MAVFASRQIVMPVLTVAVTITGTGNVSYCYATINGTKQYEAGTHEVKAGDTITFGVYGVGKAGQPYSGSVTIDGTQVLEATGMTVKTYNWIVPDGISAIEIAMSYNKVQSQRNGKIVVTTA